MPTRRLAVLLGLALTLPLDKLGIANGLVRFNGVWKWSQVTDPVTGRIRRISGQRPFDTDIYIGKQFPSLKSTLAAEAGPGVNSEPLALYSA